MGNGFSPCVTMLDTAPEVARLVYWGGRTRELPVDDLDDEDSVGRCGVSTTARDVTAELLPAGGHVVCPADSFYVGLPIPVTEPEERLLPGRTYFVLPVARLPASDGKAPVFTAATLASLSAGKKKEGVPRRPWRVPVRVRQERPGRRRAAHQGAPRVHREGDQLRRRQWRCCYCWQAQEKQHV